MEAPDNCCSCCSCNRNDNYSSDADLKAFYASSAGQELKRKQEERARLEEEQRIKSLPKEISKERWEQIKYDNHSEELDDMFKLMDDMYSGNNVLLFPRKM